LAVTAAAQGAFGKHREAMPPRDELLPGVQIPDLKIKPLQDSEK
jgi:hypothetical protein